MSSHTSSRKVARIVFDRPPLKKLNFWLWTAAGLAAGVLLGLLLNYLDSGLGDHTDVPAVLMTRECVKNWLPLAVVGLVAGMGIGWGKGRAVTAHIETVEHQPMARRRSASTALVRVDYGRKW